MYVGCKFTLKRHITVLGCKISTAGLLLDWLDLAGYEPLAVGFLDPPRQAHLGSIGKDNVAPVIGALGVVAFVVDEQGEGVGLWCVVAHGFLVNVWVSVKDLAYSYAGIKVDALYQILLSKCSINSFLGS